MPFGVLSAGETRKRVSWSFPIASTYLIQHEIVREGDRIDEKEKKELEERETRNDVLSWKWGKGGGCRETSSDSRREGNKDDLLERLLEGSCGAQTELSSEAMDYSMLSAWVPRRRHQASRP